MSLQKSFQNLDVNWGPQSLTMETMEVTNMGQEKFCSLFGRGESGQRDKMCHFIEAINHGDNSDVTFGRG